jgi:RHS repeat-associated protein
VRYDPFGSPLKAQSASNPCNTSGTQSDVFYRGGHRDPVTGDYNLGSRTYDPTKASFLQPDSYRTAQPSANLALSVDPLTQDRYSYVNGDPVNLADPNGQDRQPPRPDDELPSVL